MNREQSIAEREEQIVNDFALFDDWMGRYEYLIELGSSLPLIDDAYKTDAYRIRGCQSQVWVRPEYRDGRIFFKADSDAIITKGLIALLIKVLDGQRPAAVIDAPLEFLDTIGMKEHLSSTRKNGLASMIGQIKDFARSLERDQASAIDHEEGAAEPMQTEVLEQAIIDGIRTVFDPEIPVNVYDLGLIYEININPDRSVFVKMTLTAPNCPAAGFLPGQVESAVREVDGVTDARVEVTFDPPFTMEMMSDEARLELGLL